jgi:DNA-binding IclR family transcriptional regulator
MEADRKNFVPGLGRGLRVLELLPQFRGGLTLSQLTRHLQLPKSSVHSLLRTLQDSGYVYRDPGSGKYRVSLRVCALAHMALSGIGLREQARPQLRHLADSTGMTAHLAVMEQGSCILIEKVVPSEATRVATWIGKHLSVHCTALGKALAAYLPEDELDGLIREQGLLRHNDNTICSPRRLKQELALVRQRGYALDDEEEEINVRCIGAPVFDAEGRAIAAISIVGTTIQVHEGNLTRLAHEVIAAAAHIAERVKGATEETLTTGLGGHAGLPALFTYDRRCSQPLFPVSGPLH